MKNLINQSTDQVVFSGNSVDIFYYIREFMNDWDNLWWCVKGEFEFNGDDYLITKI